MASNRKGNRKKKSEGESYFDYTLLFAVIFLLGFGLIMIYSASSYEAFQDFGNEAYYLKKQLIAVVIGLILMVAVALIPYRFWAKMVWPAYIISAVLILAVKSSLGVSSHGARRWIKIPIIGLNLQPAEIAKVAVILAVSVLVCKIGSRIRTFKGMALIVGVSFPLAGEILGITRNLSSAIIVVAIACVMLFVANPDYKPFLVVGGLGAAGVTALVYYFANSDGSTGGFRGERIVAWLDPESQAQGVGFQTLQALYAIASGGVWGKGLGQSMQKLSFLPESQNDMIFSIICEELGLFGAGCVIFMFIVLLWRMMIVANNANDLFGAMLVTGVMAQIAVQAVLNIAVVTNTIPNTGISLPFISYGGTSVMFLLAEIGMVFSVARGIKLKDL